MSFKPRELMLALETSSADASVALWGAEGLIHEAEFKAGRGMQEQLFTALARVLDLLEAKEQQKLSLVLGLGPGSYTGVRKGIAAAQGLALARGWTCVGLPVGASLPSLALQEGFLCGDAKRGDWFLQRYTGGELGELEFFSVREWREALPRLSQELPSVSVERFWQGWEELEIVEEEFGSKIRVESPRAKVLAETAWNLDQQVWERILQRPLLPEYLRAPLITESKKAKAALG